VIYKSKTKKNMNVRANQNELERAPYKELQKLCSKYDVVFKNQPREKLIAILLKSKKAQSVDADKISDKKFIGNAIKSAHQKTNVKKKVSVKTKQTKSDRIRNLADKGKSVLDIAKLMSDTHYSFIHTVVKKHLAPHKR
jgi:hypothetical protein